MAPFGGGMEHQTMSSMGTFSFTLDAHELGHQWFGDYVTCGTWQDIWVNEGFASYSEYLALERLRSLSDATAWMESAHATVKGVPGGSVYVPASSATDESRIFSSRLSYKKGAAIIHMMRNVVNDDPLFFEVLKSFIQTHKNSVATGDDFKTSLESETGISFSNFFNQWYFGEGFPIYNFQWNQANDSLYILVSQNTSTQATTFFDTPIEFQVSFTAGADTLLRFSPAQNEFLFRIKMHREVTALQVDPKKWLVKQVNSLVKNSNLIGVITSSEQNSEEPVQVFPNPVSDGHLTIKSPNSFFDFALRDLTGKAILSGNNIAEQKTLETSNLPKGLYLLEVKKSDRDRHFQKIFIQ